MAGMNDILGQDEAVRALRGEKARGRRAHAYLFEGPDGAGRLSMARAWAAELWCLEPTPENPACGVCRHCRLLAHDAHPDYLELPRGGRELSLARFVAGATASKTDPVEHTPVLPFMQLKPVEAPFRIVVVPDAERMRGEPANAFLKTLEEPPGGSVAMLTTNARDRLPATIVSRCRRVRVLPLTEDALCAELERRGLPAPSDAESGPDAPAAVDAQAARRALAALSEGSLGFALRLAEDSDALSFWNWLGGALRARDAEGAWALARGMVERLPSGTATQAPRRVAALSMLDATALRLRRFWREEGWDARAIHGALERLWRGGEQLTANVNPELVLTTVGMGLAAELRRGGA